MIGIHLWIYGKQHTRSLHLLSKPVSSQGGHRINEPNLQPIPLNTTQATSVQGVVVSTEAKDASKEEKRPPEKRMKDSQKNIFNKYSG